MAGLGDYSGEEPEDGPGGTDEGKQCTPSASELPLPPQVQSAMVRGIRKNAIQEARGMHASGRSCTRSRSSASGTRR